MATKKEMFELIESLFKNSFGQKVSNNYINSEWEKFKLKYNLDDEKKDPHEVSWVRCDICNYEWIAVRPEGVLQLECPNCTNIGNFENIKKA